MRRSQSRINLDSPALQTPPAAALGQTQHPFWQCVSLVAATGNQSLFKSIHQESAVWQARQRVEEGQALDFVLCCLAGRDVAEDGNVMSHRRALLDRGDGQPFAVDLTVLASIPDFALP